MNMRQEVLILCVTLCLAVSFVSSTDEDDYSASNAHIKAYHDGVQRGISRRKNYVNIDEYPFFAQVILKESDNYLCGGSLISDHHVMIPASCVTDEDKTFSPEEIFVILGSDRFSKNGEIYEVSKVYVHPDFGSPLLGDNYLPSNNIAILDLESNVTMTENIVSIEYAQREDWENKNLSECESLVWLGHPDLDRKGRLGLIYSNITESAMCHEDNSVRASKTYFCASSPSVSYCNQDLGLPIVCDDTVMAMNAAIGECYDYGTHELFINVTDTFVDDVIAGRDPTPKPTPCNNNIEVLPPIVITPTLTDGCDSTFDDILKIPGLLQFSMSNLPFVLQSLRA